ncbi:putative soluble lytic transglycosylase fused to an ABC-type amino acid-binding protein [uncultured Defluviicoccus sp.]|uniref:Putative soluble lytic transglycosylase fused to an ABC-type amino acid-binding protein n=1 Tax=metagenome TaxID=256318 RepID=A0A380TJD3_9ZZZZ|nr:putative soluble lytic transglycosylase fused to an ABC-type amino acid-binding protein [uncultured Defluviicoccus sp.]
MSYSYCEGWFRARRVATKPLNETQARQRHATKGALYTAIVGDPVRPNAFVEIVGGDSIQVEFLDDQLRTHAAYQFVIQPDGRLFMVMAAFVKFGADGRQTWGRRLSFKPDGHVMSFETDYVHSPNSETVSEHRIDVSLNWEPYPSFGDYASIARYDRDRPPAESNGVAVADRPGPH